jgi:hypothetical protein
MTEIRGQIIDENRSVGQTSIRLSSSQAAAAGNQ